jgi:tetratricopeptide (TPR) repeat protein
MMTVAGQEVRAMALWGTGVNDFSTGRTSTGNEKRDWQAVINVIGDELQRADERDQAQLRHRLGYIAMLLGDARTKGIEAFTMMHDSAVALQDKRLEAMAKNGLAVAYDTIGQRRESLQYANEAARLAEEISDHRLLALALNNQAQFYKENGENERANELFRQVQAIGRMLNDEELVMAGSIGLGRTTGMAYAQTAVAHYEEALAMARAQGDERAVVICLNNLSDWKINLGLYEEAISLREECLRLSQQLGFRMGIGRAYIGMAKAYTLMGDLAKARALLNKGFPVAVRASDLEGDLHASLNLAYLYVQSEDIPRAIELYRQVLERSLAAPDHACAVFAQKALELLADEETPPPGIVFSVPSEAAELSDDELDSVVGGVNPMKITYPTGDLQW